VNEDEDYDAACEACEFWVLLESSADHKAVCDNLYFDLKKQQGSIGRALLSDIEHLGLRKDDRLEPHWLLMDVADFGTNIREFPTTVLFWRPLMNSICTHRCPLFDAALGITPKRSIALDLLHTLHLGVMLVWCNIALGMLLLSGI